MSDNDRGPNTVTLWLDPVCPFSWNAARWLVAVSGKAGFDVEWRLMNLAVLNDGQELPPSKQARMNDSRRVGRLMAALSDELGPDATPKAYFAFADQYFERAAAVDEALVRHVVEAAGAQSTTAAVLDSASMDASVAESHRASQDALGDTGGSPLLTIDGHTVFGPVFTAVPDESRALAVFDAVNALVSTPEFSQLHRPR